MGLRCVIVDDSEEFLASATRLLESEGIEVVGSATSSAHALELVQALKPDVALVDVQLGDEDGAALAYELEVRVPTTRAILISAYDLDDLADLVTADHEVGFLPKGALGAAAIEGLLG